MASYEQMLQEEADLWGRVDEQHAESTLPDWRYHRLLRHNAIMHTADIDALLAMITPGMTVLELGCASGWLTLAMAQRGAHATGLDISEKSLAIARDYYEKVQDEVAGTVTYQKADLNQLDLQPGQYDVVVTKGTLHHLVGMDKVIEQVHKALKPNGLLWVSDQDGEEALPTALFASGLMFVLPTVLSYEEKIKGLLQFGANAPERIKASMEADGLSPFEGAGRDHDWVQLVHERFVVERFMRKPAITGYLAHQLKLPESIMMPVLHAIKVMDRFLLHLGVLHSTGVIVYARKPADE